MSYQCKTKFVPSNYILVVEKLSFTLDDPMNLSRVQPLQTNPAAIAVKQMNVTNEDYASFQKEL